MMKKIGKFEELVLLMVTVLGEQAYSVKIQSELGTKLKEQLSLGSIQSTLKRLEEKGLLTSKFSAAIQKQGGKRKRIFYTTSAGLNTLTKMRDIRAGLWNSIG